MSTLENILQSIFENQKQELVSLEELFIRICFSVLMAFLIGFITAFTYTGSKLEKSILHSQILATIIFSIMINVLGKNLALAIGIFGSLSFIQFRTTVRDSKDTTLFFYSVVIGVACGSGHFGLAIIGFFIVSLCQCLLKIFPFQETKSFSVEVFCDPHLQTKIDEYLNSKKLNFYFVKISKKKTKLIYKFYCSETKINTIIENLKNQFDNSFEILFKEK
jgi:hypothetical protein